MPLASGTMKDENIKPKGELVSFISEKLHNYGGFLITAKTSHIPFTGFPPPIFIRGKFRGNG
jgi:hypothetical protein